jgi:hypothetical protein
MDLKQLLEGKGVNNIEASKHFVKTEFATIESKEDKDGVLTLCMQLKDLSEVNVNEILEVLKDYLR